MFYSTCKQGLILDIRDYIGLNIFYVIEFERFVVSLVESLLKE